MQMPSTDWRKSLMTPAETVATELICKYGIWLHPRTRTEFSVDIGEAMNRVAREVGREWREKVERLERERAELVARCAARKKP
jgi:hypothetical protein